MLDPIQRRRYGIVAMMLALIFFGVAVLAGTANAMRRHAVSEEIASANQECQNRLGVLGAKNVSQNEDQITAEWTGLDAGLQTLSNGTAAAMACPGWVMVSYCMGEGCSVKGASITLRKAVAE